MPSVKCSQERNRVSAFGQRGEGTLSHQLLIGAEGALIIPSDYLPVADGKFQTGASMGLPP